MEKFSSHRKTDQGFTLIETLIAITVLTISIVGPFQIVQGVLQTQYNARDQLIAAGLAQEGMEYLREVRDSNYLYKANNNTSANLFSGLDGSTGSVNCYANSCSVDPNQTHFAVDGRYSSGSSAANCSGACGALYIDSNYRYNQQQSGTASKFTRTVRLTQISANETKATVTVTWQNHGARSIVLTQYFKNWL